jgi:phosphonate transport system permease protein
MTRTFWRRYEAPFWLLITAAVLWWTVSGLNIRFVNLKQRWPQATKIFELMATDLDKPYFSEMVHGMLESVQMAVVGTGIAAVLALPFGFIAAANMQMFRGQFYLGKFNLNFIRTFPEIVLAILFMKGVGPGAFAGIMAMGIHSIGMLGKMYAEVIEQIDRGPIEALQSVGANRLQQLWYAVIPQVLPEFSSYAIYRFEINIRAATVLGVVGAGGIGTPLIFAILQRQWGRVGMILLGIVVVVSVVDYLSAWLRSKLV